MKIGYLALLTFLAVPLACPAEERKEFRTRGGQISWVINNESLASLDARLEPPTASSLVPLSMRNGSVKLSSDLSIRGGLIAQRSGRKILGFFGGELRPESGPKFVFKTGSVDLSHVTIRPAIPPSFSFVVQDEVGHIWATLDHPHFDFDEKVESVWLRDADLRVGKDLAQMAQHLEWTGIVIGSMDITLPLAEATESALFPEDDIGRGNCRLAWPSAIAKADLQMISLEHNPELGGMPDGISFMRCGIPRRDGSYGSCTADSTNGLAVFAPDATLKNGGTAAIAWHPMFSRRQPPYDNDQHPYLFWNLYRIDATNRISQIGRSGAKHAYHADNFGCDCPQGGAAFPECHETYSAGTNDTLHALGPRREIVANTATWGRCGSVFDPDCKSVPTPRWSEQDDGFIERMTVLESDILPRLNRSSRYVFEYGYIARDDVSIENSIAHRRVVLEKDIAESGSIRWTMQPASFNVGPAINQWVRSATRSKQERSDFVKTENGHVRLSVRVVPSSNNRYRYDYALMNEDLSYAEMSGTAPDLKVHGNRGISKIKIVSRNKISKGSISFLDSSSFVHWVFSQSDDSITIISGDSGLTWGTLGSFSLISDRPATMGNIEFSDGKGQDEVRFVVKTLIPKF